MLNKPRIKRNPNRSHLLGFLGKEFEMDECQYLIKNKNDRYNFKNF